MENKIISFDDPYEELAARFVALGKFFGELGTVPATKELIESLVSNDSDAFNRISNRVDVLILGKCYWLGNMVRAATSTPTGQISECWLREDLSPAERALYLAIVFRHWQAVHIAGALELDEKNGRQLIPPGAFRDELQANNLLVCKFRMTFETFLGGMVTMDQVCI